jgi:UDP-N-acetyl-D-mannosaminuronic acid dehydrogenase
MATAAPLRDETEEMMTPAHRFKRVSVIGLGYIGLPTAAVFASRGIEVIGVDVNEIAVQTINKGRIHIVEPDLDMVVHAAAREGACAPRSRPNRRTPS